MDVNQRFDQLESLLVDLARKQDQQAEQIKQLIAEVRRIGTAMNEQGEAIGRQGEAIGRQSEAIGRQGEAIVRIERRLDAIEEQIGAIINIFKISEARHSQAEQRQDAMLVEIRENSREIKEQGQRLDAALNVQLQMLQLMRVGNEKSDDLAHRLAPLEDHEPRLKRLEDEIFRAAS